MPCHRPLSTAPAGLAAFAAPGVAVPRVATRTAEPACPVRGGRDFSQRGKLRAGHIVEQPREPLLSGQIVPAMHLLSLPRGSTARLTGRRVPSVPGATNAGVFASVAERLSHLTVDQAPHRASQVRVLPDAPHLSTAARGVVHGAGDVRSRQGRAAAVPSSACGASGAQGDPATGLAVCPPCITRRELPSYTPGRAPSDSPEQAIPLHAPRAKARCRGARPGTSLQVAL